MALRSRLGLGPLGAGRGVWGVVWCGLLLAGLAQAEEPTDDDESTEGTEPADSAEPADGAEPVHSGTAPDADAGWLSLDVPADFGSALDSASDDAERVRADPGRVEDLVGAGLELPHAAHLRGRWYLRPRLSALGLADQGWALSAGVLLGHQWWKLDAGLLQPVGETQLLAAVPLGARGQELALVSTHGLWLGPLGLLLGPALRFDALRWGGEGLSPAWSAGLQARVGLRLGPITPWFAATPAWLISGHRARRSPWDELDLSAGVELAGPLTLRLSGSRRDTAVGARWEGVAGLHLRLL